MEVSGADLVEIYSLSLHGGPRDVDRIVPEAFDDGHDGSIGGRSNTRRRTHLLHQLLLVCDPTFWRQLQRGEINVNCDQMVLLKSSINSEQFAETACEQ